MKQYKYFRHTSNKSEIYLLYNSEKILEFLSEFCGNICLKAVQSEKKKVYLKTSGKVILCARSNEFIKLNGLELRSFGGLVLHVPFLD